MPARTRLASFACVATCLTLATVGVTSAASAQQQSPNTQAAAAPAGRTVVVPDGTELTAVVVDDLSSKTNVTGDRISLRVDEPVIMNNSVVIAKGAIIKGVVSDAKGSGRMGKGGTLNIRLESTVAVDGQRVPLRAAQGKAGDGKTGTTVALVALFGPVGLLKKGSDAKIKAGTEINVFTDETVTVMMP